MAGIVGDSILGNADVSRARERRRIARLRRLVAVGSLVLGWIVIRRVRGHNIFPTVHFPHWLGGALPIIIIVLLLGVVMFAPLIGAGRSPHTLIRPGETEVGLDDFVGIDSIKAEVVRSDQSLSRASDLPRHDGWIGASRRPLRRSAGDR